jgi:hypothetical protein
MIASAIRIAEVAPDSPEARFCLAQYFRELDERLDSGFDATKSISANPEELTPPAGVFVVANLNGSPVRCGALRLNKQSIGDIKRMWVSPDERGSSASAAVCLRRSKHVHTTPD